MCRFWCLFVLSLAICTNIGYGWHTNYDDPFQFTCRGGNPINWIKSEHHNGAEDRRWEFGCRYVRNTHFSRCRWSGYVNNWHGPFTYQCPHKWFVAGMSGIHSNDYEDRRFKFYCCKRSRRQRLHGCFYTQRTTYDNYFSIRFPHHDVMRGVISDYRNGNRDRRFTFELCHLH